MAISVSHRSHNSKSNSVERKNETEQKKLWYWRSMNERQSLKWIWTLTKPPHVNMNACALLPQLINIHTHTHAHTHGSQKDKSFAKRMNSVRKWMYPLELLWTIISRSHSFVFISPSHLFAKIASFVILITCKSGMCVREHNNPCVRIQPK